MRVLAFIACPWLATLAFWSTFVACIDAPLPEHPAAARVIVSWDPLACGEPHRIAIELVDEDGAPVSSSVPCVVGGITLDVPQFGVYLGRVYAWEAGEPIRSVVPVRLFVDEPIVRWILTTPP